MIDLSTRGSDLLGALLLHPERLAETDGLSPADFNLQVEQGTVFATYRRLADRGTPINYRTVVEDLSATGHLERVGGAEYIVNLDRGVARGLDIAGYVRELKIGAANRRLTSELEATKQQLLHDPYAITNGLRDRHIAAVEDITGALTLQRQDVFLGVEEQLAAHEHYLAHEGEETVHTGFTGLDDLTGGTRAGEVLGFMARPGTGKTLVLNNLTDYVLHTTPTQWVLFVSLEMPTAQIVERAMRIALRLSSYQLREQRAANTLDLEAYRRRYSRLLLVDRPGLSVAQIGELVRLAQNGPARAGKLVVMVDHFGLLGGERAASMYERTSAQARELKEMAKRFNVPVIVAIQVSRDAGGDGSKELGLGAARDSGVIEEAMDYLVALRQPSRQAGLSPREVDAARDRILLKLVKNRHGALGQELALKLDPLSLRMWETA